MLKEFFSSVFSFSKLTFNDGKFYWPWGRNLASRMLQVSHKSEKWQWRFFDVAMFFLSVLVTGPIFMSISLLVLDSWHFSFIRDWPEIRKSEVPPSELYQISGHWDVLSIPNLVRMSLMKVLECCKRRGKITPSPTKGMGLFGAAHEYGGGSKRHPSLKSVTHILQWWNLAKLYLT